jgi:predicted nucleic acid-binding protein
MDAVPPGDSILLDTSVLLAHLSQSDAGTSFATDLIEGCVASGRNPAAISTVTVSELLVHPHRHGRQAVDVILAFLWSIPDLLVRSVDFLVAGEAARIRASRQVAVPDAMILATGVLVGADTLATNDRALAAVARAAAPRMKVLLLADIKD